MKEFNDMTLEQQIDFVEWEIENEDQGIGYLQDILEDRMKSQEWRMKKLEALKETKRMHRLQLISSVSPVGSKTIG